MSDEKLYEEKNKWLETYYEEVTPKEFYRVIFPEGSFEQQGMPEQGKGNGIVTVFESDKPQNYLIFDDLDLIDELIEKDFVIMSAVSYFGRNRTARNARWLYGITIDLDGVGMQNMIDYFYQASNGIVPQCTCCINSGHGLHLYYIFVQPIPIYKHLHDKFKAFKYDLISLVWNRYTSTYKERNEVQYQGIFQAFRMVGSPSKLGRDYPVRAFATGERVTIEYLNKFVRPEHAVTDITYKPDLTLRELKYKYPEWYDKRIVKGEKRGRWYVKRDLYDWWLRRIQEPNGVAVGHRYSCLCVLATYAVKCGISADELQKDAFALLPFLDDMSNDEHNRFTRRDVLDALKFYKEDYVTYSRAEASRVSGIFMPPNKRNKRKQFQHLIYARGVREIKAQLGEKVSGGGRPPQAQTVKKWRAEHPNGKKAQCIRDTGLSKPTVYKWW